MLKIYVVRHGQDEDNKAGIINGHRDNPLSEHGVEQAKSLAEKIKETGLHFNAVYSSPLERAKKTAEIVSEMSGQPKPLVFNALIERDFGVMTGQKISDVKSLCGPDYFETPDIVYFTKPKNGELFDDLYVRAEKVVQSMKNKHKDGAILLVAHGDIGKMIYAAYYNIPWQDAICAFHLGNSDMICLSEDVDPKNVHVFSVKQYNN